MKTDLREAKKERRRQIAAALAGLSAEKRAADSARICAQLREFPAWRQARWVLLFAPMPEEPDIWPLLAEALAASKIAALPRFNRHTRGYAAARVQSLPEDVAVGHYGIREPVTRCPPLALSGFDLILVPGVAFDSRGGRLGHGKGYYDRLLSSVRGVKCGVAFTEQLAGEIPVGPADVRMNFVVTPEGCAKCGT